MSSVKKNLLYNMAYQILILIVPLITVPYVSRVLGAENIGVYSYTYSIVYYFMLIAMLGINNYGNRTIAKSRDNKEELSRNFLGIYSIQFTLSVIMIIIYLFFISKFEKKYTLIGYVQVIYLISNALDINWFFFGIEKFKLTVTRNAMIKIISLICILLFVKNRDDLVIYTLILSGSTLICQLILPYFLKKEISLVKITKEDILKHIKPCLILFMPVIAVSLYKVMDKIMIEKLANVIEVGYYEQAEKIINIPIGIITALGTVMLPKISNLVQKNADSQIKQYIDKSVDFMMFLAFPISFGLSATAEKVVPILLGAEFSKSIIITQLLSITILFISFANIIRTQYLIPKEKDKIFIISVSLGAIVNLILNYIFIPKYASIGACIGTIIAEFTVMFYQCFMVRKELQILFYIKKIFPYFLKALIMFAFIMIISMIDLDDILILIIQVLVGGIIYCVLNIKYIGQVINYKNKKQEEINEN